MSLLIGIAGGSGSGKTTLAKGVAAALPPGHVVVIPHDAYYRDLGHWPFSDRMGCNFDEPAALDNERLLEDLRNLRSGMAITRANALPFSCKPPAKSAPRFYTMSLAT
ncbi:MAG TPA: hypothetical protein VF524_03955, partial [Polyangia bacterium]